ncbi:hypothetical protein [Streptomyces cellulosae]|uniref:hypothetical protein n=1 Tax=Streptomyces cellulosae TaxID=1968 RepID=UPI0004CB95D5|nr:hypothetical protein [Streptomyces cellulosae]
MTCGLCGNEAGGRQLCHRDTVKLAERLTDLPTLHDELVQCLVPRRYGWGEIVSTKGAAGPQSPLDEDVLDEMSSGGMAAVVHSWRVDVQRVRWPHHSAPPPDGLAADCRWLAMELDWIAEHYPAAGDLAREVRALESRARDVVGDPVPRRKTVGQCIAVTDDQGTVCGADITHLAGESRLECRSCRTVYAGEQDLLLLLHYQPAGSA